MKPAFRIALEILFFLVFAAGMGTLLYISNRNRHEISCAEVQVNVIDGEKFVTGDEILALITRGYGVCRGERIDSIGLDRIERLVCGRDEVAGCEAWVTDDGVLHVDVRQRTPVLRFSRRGAGYYADAGGYIFPLNEEYEAPVPVIDSDLKRGFDSEWLENVISLVTTVSSSHKWRERIKSYAVADNGDFILRSDETEFIFGDFADRDRKFSYMEKYYGRVIPSCGQYKSVNLKYKGQIICRKD